MTTSSQDILNSIRTIENLIKIIKRDNLKNSDKDHFIQIMSLSLRQLEALRILSSLVMTHEKGISLKDLAKNLDIGLPSASVLVESMVKKKLFIRKENPADRRSICITLSEEGERKYRMLSQGFEKRIYELFRNLNAEETEAFCQLVSKLSKHTNNN